MRGVCSPRLGEGLVCFRIVDRRDEAGRIGAYSKSAISRFAPGSSQRFHLNPLMVALLGIVTSCAGPEGVVERGARSGVLRVPESLHVEITAADDRWRVRYHDLTRTGADLILPDAREVRVPAGARVVLHLKSTDYVYVFAIPHLELKEIAVPELDFQLEFRAAGAGRFELVGEQVCGDPHSAMPGNLVIQPAECFADWLNSRS